MGTKFFNPSEEVNSRIKWEQADAETAQKLTTAINKGNSGLVSAKIARILVFIPGVILLILWIGFIYLLVSNFSRIVNSIEIVFYIIFGTSIAFFSIFILIRYMKFRPYLYPERQAGIWIFHAKCSGIHRSGRESKKHYYADFQKGGGHIRIRLRPFEYKANPIGEEYIFYKFNSCTGNRWTAIPAKQLEEV